MSNLRIYDNMQSKAGACQIRYTVIFLNRPIRMAGRFEALGMSEGGFSQHSHEMIGRHLGKRITFEELPERCQAIVNLELEE